MSINFSKTLVIGISSRTLFDLEKENRVFQEKGIKAYRKRQRSLENEILNPGTAYHLTKALLNLNQLAKKNDRLVEVIIMSKNSPETGLRILNSIKALGLDITRSAFTGGEPISPFIEAFQVDLFLSRHESEVQAVIDSGTAAAALIYDPPNDFNPESSTVRIAFDADAVLFSDESEQIYKSKGLVAFHNNEEEQENNPLSEGPYAKLLKMLSLIQSRMDTTIELTPLRIAIVTARSSPAHLRVIKTLREWNVYVDEAFFLGGMPKEKVLKAFNAHIFFDDQETYLKHTMKVVPSGRVPYKTDSPLNKDQASMP